MTQETDNIKFLCDMLKKEEQEEQPEIDTITKTFHDVAGMKKWVDSYDTDTVEYCKVGISFDGETPLFEVTLKMKPEEKIKEWKTLTHKEYRIGSKKYLLTIQEKDA
jgi:hypothetical protein